MAQPIVDLMPIVLSVTLEERLSKEKGTPYRAIILKLIDGKEYFIFSTPDRYQLVEIMVDEQLKNED